MHKEDSTVKQDLRVCTTCFQELARNAAPQKRTKSEQRLSGVKLADDPNTLGDLREQSDMAGMIGQSDMRQSHRRGAPARVDTTLVATGVDKGGRQTRNSSCYYMCPFLAISY
jgi:hypothetical protein